MHEMDSFKIIRFHLFNFLVFLMYPTQASLPHTFIRVHQSVSCVEPASLYCYVNFTNKIKSRNTSS